MAVSAPGSTLRKILEERFSQFAGELEPLMESAANARAALARRDAAERFNQAVRRLRRCSGLGEAAAVLLETGAPVCNAAGVFRVTGNVARGERVRGIDRDEGFAGLSVVLPEAAAFRAAMETRDPVSATCAPGELSPAVASIFAGTGEQVWIFPLTVRESVAGLLLATGVTEPAWLEALAEAAGAALEARPEPPPESSLVAIEQASAPAGATHLRAQRFARVQVAELRLYNAAAVREGRTRSDLYGALRAAIDTARQTYRREFLGAPGMPDYLHVELLHTLADDDVKLLGESYPGPLV